jgi:hypothetical protein
LPLSLLLALFERSDRSALFESEWVHVLGKQPLVYEKTSAFSDVRNSEQSFDSVVFDTLVHPRNPSRPTHPNLQIHNRMVKKTLQKYARKQPPPKLLPRNTCLGLNDTQRASLADCGCMRSGDSRANKHTLCVLYRATGFDKKSDFVQPRELEFRGTKFE